MDVFAEVKRIEDEGDRLVTEAKASGAKALDKAKAEADAYRRQAETKLENESARLKAEQQKKIVEGVAAVEADFHARKDRVDQASKNVDALAGWVAETYLKGSA